MNQDEFQLKISQLFIGLSDLIADHTAASTQAEERQYQSVLTKYLCTVFILMTSLQTIIFRKHRIFTSLCSQDVQRS